MKKDYNYYSRIIKSNLQAVEFYIKRKGYIEELGRNELGKFEDDLRNDDNLTYSEKMDLLKTYYQGLNNL